MEFTGYKGPYENGMPTRRVADDGTVWREATPRELSEASADLLIYFGKPGTSPVHVNTYAQYKLPGNYPFLVGISQLLPVYVQDTSEEDRTGECGMPGPCTEHGNCACDDIKPARNEEEEDARA
jgi:hypothetical protein